MFKLRSRTQMPVSEPAGFTIPTSVEQPVPTTTQPQPPSRSEQPTISEPHTRPTTVRRRSSQSTINLYERIGTLIALLGAFALSVGLWALGAFFTLQWARTLPQIGILFTSHWAWFLPIAITAIEVFLWPKRQGNRLHTLYWLGVLAIDTYTTYVGIYEWAQVGHTAAGIALPTTGALLVIPAILIAIGLAIIPERAARTQVTQIRDLLMTIF